MELTYLLGGFFFLLIFVMIGLFFLVAYILTLIKQLKAKEYAWFVLTLFFPVVLLIYWLVKLISKITK